LILGCFTKLRHHDSPSLLAIRIDKTDYSRASTMTLIWINIYS
jgi:hypothetical protein